MPALDRLARWLAEVFKWVGGAAVAAMLIITCLDVVFRGVGRPVWGLVETVTLLAVLALACSLPVTQLSRGHVALDMVVRRLPARIARSVEAVGHSLSFGLFGVVAWRLWVYADTLQGAGQVTMGLEFPSHYLVRVLALAFGALCLALAADALNAVRKAVRA